MTPLSAFYGQVNVRFKQVDHFALADANGQLEGGGAKHSPGSISSADDSPYRRNVAPRPTCFDASLASGTCSIQYVLDDLLQNPRRWPSPGSRHRSDGGYRPVIGRKQIAGIRWVPQSGVKINDAIKRAAGANPGVQRLPLRLSGGSAVVSPVNSIGACCASKISWRPV